MDFAAQFVLRAVDNSVIRELAFILINFMDENAPSHFYVVPKSHI